MNEARKRITRYLVEAHASEVALVSVLRTQIAMTPRGNYRGALDRHVKETERHARRTQGRLEELDPGTNPIRAGVSLVRTLTGQVLAFGKAPLDLLRGEGGEEKVLKNAKDAVASEALEIATYTALEAAAAAAGDDATARLAASILREEERMLQGVLDEIPHLARLVVDAEQSGESSYDVTETGAADAVREVGRAANRAVDNGHGQVRRAARQTRKVPGVARATGEVNGAIASPGDLPISGYDSLTAQEIVERLPGLSQVDLATVEAYERRHEGRTTIKHRIASLRAQEPWPGYDELTAGEVREALLAGDDSQARTVATYERRHKNRNGVLEAAERELNRS